jgi:hypothetical protein
VALPLSADSVLTQSGYLPYAQGFVSLSPATAHPHVSSEVLSDLEARIATRIRTPHAHDDALDLNTQFPMEISRRPSESAPSIRDIAAHTLRPGDSQQGGNQS